jgi:hypothetical protein
MSPVWLIRVRAPQQNMADQEVSSHTEEIVQNAVPEMAM